MTVLDKEDLSYTNHHTMKTSLFLIKWCQSTHF